MVSASSSPRSTISSAAAQDAVALVRRRAASLRTSAARRRRPRRPAPATRARSGRSVAPVNLSSTAKVSTPLVHSPPISSRASRTSGWRTSVFMQTLLKLTSVDRDRRCSTGRRSTIDLAVAAVAGDVVQLHRRAREPARASGKPRTAPPRARSLRPAPGRATTSAATCATWKRCTSAASRSERRHDDDAPSSCSQARRSQWSRRARRSARSLVGSRRQRSSGSFPPLARKALKPRQSQSRSSRSTLSLATRCARSSSWSSSDHGSGRSARTVDARAAVRSPPLS